MDGVASDNAGVFVLGATNHPWDVDVALRRPGRFDRMLLVLPPDEAARRAVLRHHLDGRPIQGVDVDALAARTEGTRAPTWPTSATWRPSGPCWTRCGRGRRE